MSVVCPEANFISLILVGLSSILSNQEGITTRMIFSKRHLGNTRIRFVIPCNVVFHVDEDIKMSLNCEIIDENDLNIKNTVLHS